MIGGGEH